MYLHNLNQSTSLPCDKITCSSLCLIFFHFIKNTCDFVKTKNTNRRLRLLLANLKKVYLL
jgi:hypothetical protein